jgi:hypothetical protein
MKHLVAVILTLGAGAAVALYLGHKLGRKLSSQRCAEAVHRAEGTEGGVPQHKWADFLTVRLLVVAVGALALYYEWSSPLARAIGTFLIVVVPVYWRSRYFPVSFDNMGGFKSWERDPNQ